MKERVYIEVYRGMVVSVRTKANVEAVVIDRDTTDEIVDKANDDMLEEAKGSPEVAI